MPQPQESEPREGETRASEIRLGDVRVAVEPSGDAAVLVEISGADGGARRRAVHLIRDSLLEHPFTGFVDLLASYEHVFVTIDSAITDVGAAIAAVTDRVGAAGAPRHNDGVTDAAGPARRAHRVFSLPVVFGGAHGPDLEELAAELGITADELVARATSTDFTVDFLGTAMQPMCTGAIADRPVPRRRTPRTRLPGGSIGLAAHNLTVYPFDAPGGWQLIGRTPLTVVDLAHELPVEYASDDVLRLRAIDASEWDAWAGRPLTPEGAGAGAGEHAHELPMPAGAAVGGDAPLADDAPHSGSLRVIRAGSSQLQDLGRVGHERDGLGAGGALDQLAAARANILAGNPRGAPLIEVTGFDAEFEAGSDALVAVAGATCVLTVDGVAHPLDSPVAVRRGQSIAIGSIAEGLRVYLAISGTIDAPMLAGSCAPDPVLGFGTRLAGGGTIGFTSDYGDFEHPVFGLPLFRFAMPHESHGPVWRIPITTGTDADELADGIGALTSPEFVVAAESDAVGQRLTGPPTIRRSVREPVSRGIPIGGIELVPSGDLIVLQRSRYITAGYPIVGVVTREGLSFLAQAAPGRRLRFELQSVEDATAAWRRRLASLDELEQRVGTAFAAAGIRPHRQAAAEERGRLAR